MNAEAREDLRQMLLEQLDVERSEYDGAQDALRAMDPDKVLDEGYVQVANRNRAAERIQKLKNAMAELEYLHQAKETSPEETTPELAFLDSIKLIVNEEGLLQELPINWKAMELYQYGYMSGIVGTAVLAAARGDELIGFAKPVCETICEEFGIDMEDGIWND